MKTPFFLAFFLIVFSIISTLSLAAETYVLHPEKGSSITIVTSSETIRVPVDGPKKITLDIQTDGSLVKKDCLTAYGNTKCGYSCISGYGNILCAEKPDQKCVSAYGHLKCGYDCVAAYGKIKCAKQANEVCTASNGQIICSDDRK